MAQPPRMDGQGQRAERPSEIPKGGWWQILKRVYASLQRKNLSILAAGVAFYAMLSVFPALAALGAIYGLLADPATVQRQINEIHGILPVEAQNVIVTYSIGIAAAAGFIAVCRGCSA